MIQDIIIGCGIVAAIILSFFFLGYGGKRPSDGRTVVTPSDIREGSTGSPNENEEI